LRLGGRSVCVRRVPGAASDVPLHEHCDWVRRVARQLVGRKDLAEDLAQQALLVALQSPPAADRPLRPWLRGVLHNLYYKHRRGEARRFRREQIAAYEGTEQTPVEMLAAQGCAGRLIFSLVATLAEPYRSTVPLRCPAGLSSAG